MRPASHRRILVVDGQLTMRVLTRQCLQRIGVASVVGVGSGERALEVLAAEPFDLVLCDWHLGGISGLELLTRIRADPVTGELPFIMATSENGRAQVLAAKQAGVTNYILKPFSAVELRKKIEAVLGPLA